MVRLYQFGMAACLTRQFLRFAGDALLVNTSTWKFEDFVADDDGSSGALMFSDGSTESAVHLTGIYDPAGFQAVVVGSQTKITYTS